MAGDAMPWTAEENALAVRLWREGHTATQISREIYAQLHVEKSRNAVIGRLHRMGMTHAGRVNPPRPAKPRSAYRRPRVAPMPKPEPAPVITIALPEPLNVPFVERTEGQCVAVTDATRFAQTCCGHPVATGSRYCAAHTQLHYQPSDSAKKRKRATERLAAWMASRDGYKAQTAGLTL